MKLQKLQRNNLSAFLSISEYESSFLKKNISLVGIDEVGRGSMAGPMVVCGFLLTSIHSPINGIRDSKLLSAKKRNLLQTELIKETHKLIEIPSEFIDDKGLTFCFKDAISQIMMHFGDNNIQYLVDGNTRFTNLSNIESIIDGDNTHYSIACASIIAKEYRDNLMRHYSTLYPQYGFDKNVGYCTALHLNAIKEHGIIPIHRKSYKPIRILGN